MNAPLFTGGPVTWQTLLTPAASKDFNLGIVDFGPGARNKMHTHSSDQVLFVTAGKGIIATETEQQVIVAGDVVHIPSEERHWHGATHDSARAAGDELPTPPDGTRSDNGVRPRARRRPAGSSA